MKVLHVVPWISPSHGGPSRAVVDMVHGLARVGVTAHLATTDADGPGRRAVPLGQAADEDGVTCWCFPHQTRFYTVSWPLTAWLWRHVPDYDLVHIHTIFSYALVPAAFFAWRSKVPYVLTLHGILRRWGLRNRKRWLKRVSLYLIERRILGRAALVHYTTEQERLETQELGLFNTPSVVIPLGIDLSTFEHLPAPGTFQHQYPQLAGRTLILFLSRLDPIKGLDLLLPAFARVHQARPDTALVLAGAGTPAYQAKLRAQVSALGLEGHVLFTGFLQDEQKLAALADCDLLVQPSYSESFGVTVVEAMACGLPVVISQQVGISHEVAQAEAGVVVSCQEEALAGALLRLMGDTELRRRLGANGRRLARQLFSLEALTARLVEEYQHLT